MLYRDTWFLHYNKKSIRHTFTTILIVSLHDLDKVINIFESKEHRRVNG